MLIEHPIQVRILAEDVRPWRKGFKGTVALALTALSPEENLAFQTRLNRLFGACGCRTGAVGSLAALALVVIGAVSGSDLGTAATVGMGSVAFLAGGALGKGVGLVHAHLQLRRTLAELYGRVTPRRPGRESRMPLVLVPE
ncbi:MAG: hypothetical protein R3E98_01855 [Gemmatimonadota bacterium]|nr:hypothetical protein [Gemmatimonadota bacterium]